MPEYLFDFLSLVLVIGGWLVTISLTSKTLRKQDLNQQRSRLRELSAINIRDFLEAPNNTNRLLLINLVEIENQEIERFFGKLRYGKKRREI